MASNFSFCILKSNTFKKFLIIGNFKYGIVRVSNSITFLPVFFNIMYLLFQHLN